MSHLFHKDTQVHIILIYSNGVKLKARPSGSRVKKSFGCLMILMLMMFFDMMTETLMMMFMVGFPGNN